MDQRRRPRLICDRFTAAIAVLLTGYITALTVRSAFWQSPHHFHWILQLDHLLPPWAVLAANVAVYLWMLWLCVVFPRTLDGKERALVAGWVPSLVLSPIQGIVSASIAKFMPWEPPSWSEYVTRCEKRVQASEPNKFSFVIRRLDNKEGLGMASLEDGDSVSPEIGLWLKESVHGQRFGREVVASLVEWGHSTLGKGSFIYPVAVQNTASKRIAESLHGEIIGNRTNPKFESVVYRIPFYETP